MSPFRNPARKDGLVLRHWKRKKLATVAPLGEPATPADVKTEGDADSKSTQSEPEYHFAKFDVKVNVPKYSDSEHESLLKSDDWNKEETDYLVNLALEYDLRWIVIADRYDYRSPHPPPIDESVAVAIAPKTRTMEDMKARYYEVSAKIMAHRHPLSSMSTTEFELHEKMTKFNPTQEMTRKKLAEALLSRSPEEIREEEILLGELKRIVMNQERFSEERKELYSRLDAPPSNGSIAMYESSQGLGQLMQTLLAVDKKKRRALMGPNDGASSPATAGPQNSAGQGSSRDQRNSIGSATNKKGSVSLPPTQRHLSSREEAKFGITHHERLTSGVQFRSARIDKLVLAKSAAQSTKLQEALTELGIPHKAVMPTAKVCAEYERLIQGVQTLLDVRKVSEKVESEIRVLQAQKRERERREAGEEPETPAEEIKGELGEDEDEDAKAEAERDVRGQDEEEEDKGEGDDINDDAEEDDDGDKDAEGEVEDDGEEAEDGNDVDQAVKPSDDEEEEQADEEREEENEEANEEDNEEDGSDQDEEDDFADDPATGEQWPGRIPTWRDSAARKRSASLLSAQSEKSTKKQKK